MTILPYKWAGKNGMAKHYAFIIRDYNYNYNYNQNFGWVIIKDNKWKLIQQQNVIRHKLRLLSLNNTH